MALTDQELKDAEIASMVEFVESLEFDPAVELQRAKSDIANHLSTQTVQISAFRMAKEVGDDAGMRSAVANLKNLVPRIQYLKARITLLEADQKDAEPKEAL